MIAHLVLFRPRPDLPADEAGHLIASFERALREIPAITRAQVGRRITIGRGYEQMMRTDYAYVALLEFDNVDGLRAYLAHPAHSGVGNAIFAAAADILVYDFETAVGSDGISAAAARP